MRRGRLPSRGDRQVGGGAVAERTKGVTWRRIVALARPEAPRLAIATVSLVFGSAMGLMYPKVISELIDGIGPGQSPTKLDAGVLLLIGMFVVESVFTAVRAWLFTVSGERVVATLRNSLFAAILRQDIAFFDAARTGELTNRLSADTTVLQNAVSVNVSMALRFGLTTIGAVVLLFWMNPTLTALAMSIVPVVAIGGALYGRMVRQMSKDVQDALADSTQIAEEALSSVRTVRAFGREPEVTQRYAGAVNQSFELAARRALAMGAFNGVGGLAFYLSVAIIVWYGGRMVLDGRMTPGDLTAFLLYTMAVGGSIAAIAGVYGDFMKAIGASERVFELIDRKSPLESSTGEPLGEIRGAFRFDAVRFRYPTRPDAPVLEGFELDVAPGEVVALVGPSGGGKSTVASLLLRFYDPDAGSVSIDGRDLRTVDPHALRDRIGIVSQEPVLFASSIADNIRFGRPGVTQAEVVLAAKAANAHDFVSAFPSGYATLVGERGVQLSGGQKQRIAIARALLKDPPILVLDEATSALDAESEHLVQDALDRLMKGRTTLVIAHRLSTVQGADRVVVLEHGRVAEVGTHQSLLAVDGLYRRLVQRQFAAVTGPAAPAPG